MKTSFVNLAPHQATHPLPNKIVGTNIVKGHLQKHPGFATINLRVSMFHERNDQLRLDSLDSNCVGIDISYDIAVSSAIIQGRSETREHPGQTQWSKSPPLRTPRARTHLLQVCVLNLRSDQVAFSVSSVPRYDRSVADQ